MRTSKCYTPLVSLFSFELVETFDTYLFTPLVIKSFPRSRATQPGSHIAGRPTDDLHSIPFDHAKIVRPLYV